MSYSTAESTRVGCDVTWDQYQLMLLKEDTVHFLLQDSSEAWWSMRMAAHYDQDQKEPCLIMKIVLINCKLNWKCMLSSWRETVSPLPHVSINLILGLPFHGNTEQIGNTDKLGMLLSSLVLMGWPTKRNRASGSIMFWSLFVNLTSKMHVHV